MAKFELPIYGEHDEVIKTYETNVVRWGVFIKATEMQDRIKSASVTEQINGIGDILQMVFVGLTKDELAQAGFDDIFNTFQQITNIGNKINGGNGSKNA